jgi:tetratricopeptide (TPR) repeat protein
VRVATDLGYRPLQAEALHVLGRLQMDSGKFADAERTLRDAVGAAEAGRADELKARAENDLVILVAQKLDRPEDGLGWSRQSAATIERLGGDDRLQAGLLRNVGMVQIMEGKFADAEATERRALALAEKVRPADEQLEDAVLDQLGEALRQQGKLDEAMVYYERSLALALRMFGPDHPWVAQTYLLIAKVHAARGEYTQALEQLEHARAIAEAALGPDDRVVARILSNEGNSYMGLGRYADAERALRRALAIQERLYGAEHNVVATTLFNLANTYYYAGRLDEAIEVGRRALAIREKQAGADNPDVGASDSNLGDYLVAKKQPREALPYYEKAIAIFEKISPTDLRVAYPLTGMGGALVDLGEAPRAVALLERALAIHEAQPGDPAVAGVRFTLARALWEAHGDLARARALATRALEDERKMGPSQATEVGNIEAWLKDH